jgi:hypothetical protein
MGDCSRSELKDDHNLPSAVVNVWCFEHNIAHYKSIMFGIKGPILYLVSVPGTLVVIWERNDGGTHSQNHSWMNLAVCVRSTVGIFLVLPQVIG